MSRLYLIDDHALVREGLRAVVQAAGHEVVGEASEPTPALADLARLQPELVLLDLNLGQRSGFELLQEMPRRHLRIPVIVLTMSDQPRHVAEALRAGAGGYVLKGSPGVELLEAIDSVLAGRPYLSKQAAEVAARALHEPRRQGETLSPRERQILVMVARGASSTAIGEQLHLSPKTVDTYRSRLMAKLGLNDIPSVVRWAIREGLVGADE